MKKVFVASLAYLMVCAAAVAHDKAEIIDAHVKAVGGLEAFGKITTITRSGDAKLGGIIGDMAGTFQEKTIVGKKAFTSTDLDAYQDRSAWDGSTGWTENSMAGLMDLPKEQEDVFKAQTRVEPIVHAVKEGRTDAIKLLDHETIDGTEYHVVEIEGEGGAAKYYLDPETNLVGRFSATFKDPQMGETSMVVKYSDHSEHGGIKFPGKVVVDIGEGTVTVVYMYKETTLNEAIDDSTFERPKS